LIYHLGLNYHATNIHLLLADSTLPTMADPYPAQTLLEEAHGPFAADIHDVKETQNDLQDSNTTQGRSAQLSIFQEVDTPLVNKPSSVNFCPHYSHKCPRTPYRMVR
jgi:hypothetical protein